MSLLYVYLRCIISIENEIFFHLNNTIETTINAFCHSSKNIKNGRKKNIFKIQLYPPTYILFNRILWCDMGKIINCVNKSNFHKILYFRNFQEVEIILKYFMHKSKCLPEERDPYSRAAFFLISCTRRFRGIKYFQFIFRRYWKISLCNSDKTIFQMLQYYFTASLLFLMLNLV